MATKKKILITKNPQGSNWVLERWKNASWNPKPGPQTHAMEREETHLTIEQFKALREGSWDLKDGN